MARGLEDNLNPHSDSDCVRNMETDEEYVVPIGLISRAIENHNYCKMLEFLEIDHPTANELTKSRQLCKVLFLSFCVAEDNPLI